MRLKKITHTGWIDCFPVSMRNWALISYTRREDDDAEN